MPVDFTKITTTAADKAALPALEAAARELACDIGRVKAAKATALATHDAQAATDRAAVYADYDDKLDALKANLATVADKLNGRLAIK